MNFISLESDRSIINDFDECVPHVVIPSYVRVIGPCTFMDETVLQSIKMPSGLETIGSQAFFGCINLSDVTIPDTVTNIEEQAFIYCSSLKDIKLPESLTELGCQAFESCTNLAHIEIPSGVKSIQLNTFYACESLKKVVLPAELLAIESCAFGNCKSLKEITIPESVTSIDDDAFEGDRGLIIRGRRNSFAERYATKHDIAFMATDNIGQSAVAIITETFLSTNPFYTLNLPCTADRKAIVSAAEEQSFFCDAQACTEAQNALLNPSKRLSAELNWFLEESESTASKIRDCIQNLTPIPTGQLSPLSKLNATLYNFSISSEGDSYEIGYSILEIDSLYSAINQNELYDSLCKVRRTGNLPVSSRSDFEKEYNAKRQIIRQVIKSKLSKLTWQEYTDLVTIIAEKYIASADYNDGIILSDVIDSYEVEISDEINREADDIMLTEESIRSSVNNGYDIDVRQKIEFLISQVTNWDKKVQPLQLRSMASGMPHKLSEDVGRAMRNLALYLNNELHDTENALLLVQAMKPVFAEIKSLSDIFTKDSDDLNDILVSQKEMDLINEEIDSVKKYMLDIKTCPNESKIDLLISKVKSLDKKILIGGLRDDEMQGARESVCTIVRGFAIELHNSHQKTDLALRLTEALIDIFGDIPAIRDRLNNDISTLRQQLRIKEANEKQRRTTVIARLVTLAVVACIALWLWIDSNNGHLTKQDVPAVSYSSSLETGTKVYADIKSIFPAVGIYTEGSSNYSDFVCECKTSSGKTVWVYMTTTEYKNNFDSTASTSTKAQYAEEIKFSGTKRIQGTTQKADSVMSGLADDINSTMVINFSSVE